MKDTEILARVHELVDEEHALREARAAGRLDEDTEHARLQRVEAALDQCWDLLRQRRAKREAGEDPDTAEVRPVAQVESYLS